MSRDELLDSHKRRDVILDARLADSVVYFDPLRGGGTLDSTAQVVTGVSPDGVSVTLDYAEIEAFRVRRRNETQTAIVAVALTAVAVGVIVAFVALADAMGDMSIFPQAQKHRL
jgi:hypothetical protein